MLLRDIEKSRIQERRIILSSSLDLYSIAAIDRQKRTREFLCDTTSSNFGFRFFCHVVVVE